MDSEDEVIKRLKRIPYDEICQKKNDHFLTHLRQIFRRDSTMSLFDYGMYGWTREEFINESNRRLLLKIDD